MHFERSGGRKERAMKLISNVDPCIHRGLAIPARGQEFDAPDEAVDLLLLGGVATKDAKPSRRLVKLAEDDSHG